MTKKDTKKASALGRGLGSILSDVDMAAESWINGQKGFVTTAITTIPLDQIETNPFQPRKEFDEASLSELASSIKQQGVITPITVRQMPDGKYQLIAGERRCRAAKQAGLSEIPAYIRMATDTQMMEMALVENIQRENLNAMEIAFSYNALLEECQLTQEELSERVGKDRSTVSNYLRLLNLPSETQLALMNNKITFGHARALVNIDNADDHIALLHTTIDKDLTVRQTEQLVKDYLKNHSTAPRISASRKAELPPYHEQQKAQLSDRLGRQIDITRNRVGRGTVTIHFKNDDDFRKLMQLLEED